MSAEAVEPDNEWLPDVRSCPSWCDKAHETVVVETGDWTSAQTHRGFGCGGHLDEMRNSSSGRVTRPGGASWDLDVTQEPYGPNGGFSTVATIALRVSAPGHARHVELPLTSGDARVLARQLLHLADAIDLS